MKKTAIIRKVIKLSNKKEFISILWISKIVKNIRIICNNKILKTCNFCEIFEVNFSYSKKTKLKSIEKKIVTKGFPNKNSDINNKDNIVVEINLCLNSLTFVKDIMFLIYLIIPTIFSYSSRVI